MRKLLFFALASAFVIGTSACKKEISNEGLNVLNGETDIPLTVLGSVTDLYISLGGTEINGTMTLIEKDGGICTYHALIDFTGHPDSALYATLIPRSNFDAQGRFIYDIKAKITSEGIQEYSFPGSINNPWTIVKYDDPVGTIYPFREGSPNYREITEKTGVDDYPLGFMLIKVSKIEQPYPASDLFVKKITFYANHKFGLVGVEVLLKNNSVVKCDIYPWFLL